MFQAQQGGVQPLRTDSDHASSRHCPLHALHAAVSPRHHPRGITSVWDEVSQIVPVALPQSVDPQEERDEELAFFKKIYLFERAQVWGGEQEREADSLLRREQGERDLRTLGSGHEPKAAS